MWKGAQPPRQAQLRPTVTVTAWGPDWASYPHISNEIQAKDSSLVVPPGTQGLASEGSTSVLFVCPFCCPVFICPSVSASGGISGFLLRSWDIRQELNPVNLHQTLQLLPVRMRTRNPNVAPAAHEQGPCLPSWQQLCPQTARGLHPVHCPRPLSLPALSLLTYSSPGPAGMFAPGGPHSRGFPDASTLCLEHRSFWGVWGA